MGGAPRNRRRWPGRVFAARGARARAGRVALALAGAACGVCLGWGPARAAYEWRPGWGAPYLLAPLEEQISRAAQPARGWLHVAQPFGVPGLRFEQLALFGVPAGTQLRLGRLAAPGYEEFSGGIAVRVGATRALALRAGLRGFATQAGGEWTDATAGVTLAVEWSRPAGLPCNLSGGLVDREFGGRGSLAQIAYLRIGAAVGAHRLLVERAAVADLGGETSLAALFGLGALHLRTSLRTLTGETGLAIGVPVRQWIPTVGGRWHPALGWTPLLSLQRCAHDPGRASR